MNILKASLVQFFQMDEIEAFFQSSIKVTFDIEPLNSHLYIHQGSHASIKVVSHNLIIYWFSCGMCEFELQFSCALANINSLIHVNMLNFLYVSVIF